MIRSFRRLSTAVTSPVRVPRPREPELWECCGDDCPHCVWTVYFEQLAEYEKQAKDSKKPKE